MVSQMLLQKTPLNRAHIRHGGKLVEFGGWEMPLQFTKVLDEHHAVRKACGLFDISHMGVLAVRSGDVQTTLNAINYLIPQDLTKIYPGKAVYTQLLNPQGGIIDDIIVYWMASPKHFPEFTEFMIICNAANTRKVMAWMQQHFPAGVTLDWLNEKYSLMALQGPAFEKVLAACGLNPEGPLPKRFHIGEYQLDGKNVLLSRTGYTGEDGVEILVAVSEAESLWESLLEKGSAFEIKPIGLAARDTLRLEAAYPLHGSELSETITPLEAGLGWSVKLDQPGDFIGKAALLAQQASGLKRHFICFEVLKKSIPRHLDLLYDKDGQTLGEVTSGSISPTLDKPIGVGYVTTLSPPAPGTPLQVGIRGNMVEAQVVERPFYRK
jgi:aminomethyltransferase